jgi:hypothetical protein
MPAGNERRPISSKGVPLSEAGRRATLVDSPTHEHVWSEDPVCSETTLEAVEIVLGK